MVFDKNTENILSKIKTAIQQSPLAESVFKRVSLGSAVCKSDGATARVLNSQKLINNDEESKDSILSQFEEDQDFLANINDAGAREETAFFLLQKYGSRLCAADDKEGKFSLFDNYRIDKAVAGGGKMLLIKGDFSGIQSFIYNDIKTDQIGNMRKVARELRGKSFFVSMLTDLIAEQFLDAFGLAYENLLFAGGGHFNILLPLDENTLADAREFTKRINQSLPGSLNLILATTETSGDELVKNAGKVFDAVNRQRDRAKYHAFSDGLSDVFEGKQKENKDGDIEIIKKVGGILPKVNYILQIESKSKPTYTEDFMPFYSSYPVHLVAFVSEGKTENIAKDIRDYLNKISDSLLSVKILSLNNTGFLDLAPYLKDTKFPISYAFRFIGKYAPKSQIDEDDIDKDGTKYKNYLADFTELAKTPPGKDITEESKKKFYPKLAFLRLDIDDLGAVFSIGQKKNKEGKTEDTLKHIAVLSRELNLFFSGHFNILAERHHCYVVYSGGDDAFVVGSWLNVIHFVKELRSDFEKFTAHNTDLHFSAGVFTCNSHYPVAKAANDAGKLEERAKMANAVNVEDKSKTNNKNRICIFNHTLDFPDFVDMTDLGQDMIKYTAKKDGSTEKKLTKSLVYKILDMIKHSFEDVVEQDSNGNLVKFKAIKSYNLNLNRMRIHNLFARHGFTEKYNREANNDLTNKVVKILLENFSEDAAEKDILQNYTVALNYVLFNIRKPKE